MKIREYQLADQQGVLDLILPIQQQEFGIAITQEDQPDLCQVRSFYQTGKGNFWVAEDNGVIVGTIALIDIGEGQGALRKMFVHKDYRGAKQTAKKLLDMLLVWAKKKELQEIYLGTTDKFLAAHRFYEKNGFVEMAKEQLPSAFPVMKVDSRFYKYTL